MKGIAWFCLACCLAVATGCSRGPSEAEVETAFREAFRKNDFMGFLDSAVRIEAFQVDRIDRKEDGVYEAAVTFSSSARFGPLSLGGATRTTVRLKKLGERWVVLY